MLPVSALRPLFGSPARKQSFRFRPDAAVYTDCKRCCRILRFLLANIASLIFHDCSAAKGALLSSPQLPAGSLLAAWRSPGSSRCKVRIPRDTEEGTMSAEKSSHDAHTRSSSRLKLSDAALIL